LVYYKASNLVDLNDNINTNLSVADINKSMDLSIYPNPFTSQTNILFSQEQKNIRIRITDISGKEIKTIYFTGRKLTIDRAEMNAGIYFVQISDEQKNLSNKKIIVQ
jgi:hypothetical protein